MKTEINYNAQGVNVGLQKLHGDYFAGMQVIHCGLHTATAPEISTTTLTIDGSSPNTSSGLAVNASDVVVTTLSVADSVLFVARSKAGNGEIILTSNGTENWAADDVVNILVLRPVATQL